MRSLVQVVHLVVSIPCTFEVDKFLDHMMSVYISTVLLLFQLKALLEECYILADRVYSMAASSDSLHISFMNSSMKSFETMMRQRRAVNHL